MARVLGHGGRYCRQEARGTERRMLILGLTTMALMAWLSGYTCPSVFRNRPPLWTIITGAVTVAAAVITYFWFNHRLEALDKKRDDLRKGESGEVYIAYLLTHLPSNYFVVNGLSMGEGDIDHIVIGPTGVFAIDTKTWTGTVKAAPNRELLLDGTATHKPEVSNFVSRVVDLKESLEASHPNTIRYIKALFVFTLAWVDAKWGKTGHAYCIRHDQLIDHILDNRPREGKISWSDSKTIARAVKEIAYKDPRFPRKGNERQTTASGTSQPAATQSP